MNWWFVFICVFFYSCGTVADSPIEKERISNQVIRKAAKLISSETGLMPCGVGGGAMNQIRMLAISFNSRKELNVDSGRHLLVRSVELFKSIIDSDEAIRPYLINYPFMIENIEIRIFIQKEDGSSFGVGKLSVISLLDGVLRFKIDSLNGLGLETIHEETYAEALEKISHYSSQVRSTQIE